MNVHAVLHNVQLLKKKAAHLKTGAIQEFDLQFDAVTRSQVKSKMPCRDKHIELESHAQTASVIRTASCVHWVTSGCVQVSLTAKKEKVVSCTRVTSFSDFLDSTRGCQCAMGFRGYASISFQ